MGIAMVMVIVMDILIMNKHGFFQPFLELASSLEPTPPVQKKISIKPINSPKKNQNTFLSICSDLIPKVR